MMQTKPKILKSDLDWVDAKNSCRTTVGKDGTDKKPDWAFKRKLMISEHSPIRQLRFTWIWNDIYSWVATHYVRHHIGVEKWVSSQRSDRTGIQRDELPQNASVSLKMEANAQALINMARFRLCYQASPETRKCMEDLKIAVSDIDSAIGDVMVPNCVYRAGCPEFKMCEEKFWIKFLTFCQERNLNINTIQRRYEAYNLYYALNKGLLETKEAEVVSQ